MVCKTFKSCLVGSSKTNACRNNLLACRVSYVLSGSFVRAIEMIDVHQNSFYADVHRRFTLTFTDLLEVVG